MGADHCCQLQAEALIADKAFDAEKRVIQRWRRRKNCGDPAEKGRKFPRDYDVNSTRRAI